MYVVNDDAKALIKQAAERANSKAKFAKEMGISRSMLYRIIEVRKDKKGTLAIHPETFRKLSRKIPKLKSVMKETRRELPKQLSKAISDKVKKRLSLERDFANCSKKINDLPPWKQASFRFTLSELVKIESSILEAFPHGRARLSDLQLVILYVFFDERDQKIVEKDFQDMIQTSHFMLNNFTCPKVTLDEVRIYGIKEILREYSSEVVGFDEVDKIFTEVFDLVLNKVKVILKGLEKRDVVISQLFLFSNVLKSLWEAASKKGYSLSVDEVKFRFLSFLSDLEAPASRLAEILGGDLPEVCDKTQAEIVEDFLRFLSEHISMSEKKKEALSELADNSCKRPLSYSAPEPNIDLCVEDLQGQSFYMRSIDIERSKDSLFYTREHRRPLGTIMEDRSRPSIYFICKTVEEEMFDNPAYRARYQGRPELPKKAVYNYFLGSANLDLIQRTISFIGEQGKTTWSLDSLDGLYESTFSLVPVSF